MMGYRNEQLKLVVHKPHESSIKNKIHEAHKFWRKFPKQTLFSFSLIAKNLKLMSLLVIQDKRRGFCNFHENVSTNNFEKIFGILCFHSSSQVTAPNFFNLVIYIKIQNDLIISVEDFSKSVIVT